MESVGLLLCLQQLTKFKTLLTFHSMLAFHDEELLAPSNPQDRV